MVEYERLLQEVKAKVHGMLGSTAEEYVPKMYKALRNEIPSISPTEARDRIQRDCIDVWKKRTILKFLPEEAKDPKKQKSGRLGQKKRKSAALPAAQVIEKVVIDTEGKPVHDPLPTYLNFSSTTADDLSQSCDRDQLKRIDNNHLQLEFGISRELIQSYIFLLIANESQEREIKFNLIFDKSTSNVISVDIVVQNDITQG